MSLFVVCRRPRLWAMTLVPALLAGCDFSGQDELRAWMAEQQRITKPKVEPISEPKKFVPEQYTQANLMEPFSNVKLAQALRRETALSVRNSLIGGELNRRKEPLESYPLDALSMVGSMSRTGEPVALVKVDNLVYQVRVGNYMGQNYGRVRKISETEVVLREIVQDAAGEWIERLATMQLQEKTK